MGGSHEFIIPAETPWLCDSTVQRLFAAFLDAGEELYFVGGCVRNAVLGAPVSDIDLSTSALPETTMAIVKAAGFKPVPTGIDHGTITAVRDGQPFEITTFRKDVETDGRRAVVAFSKNLREDALRRDFTMNALYADQTGRVIDPTGGLPDARAGRIRFIENPHDRIREDHLRILRFFRFSAWYGNADLGFDADVLAAIADLSDGVLDLSKERVGQEMLKLLVAPNPVPAVAAMSQIGVLSKILPGADPQFLGPLVHLEEQSGTQPDPLR
ncbi:MAG: CCA tRNA nucleotidyltransferase, partial [Rhodobacteraceae bacterium]|nr:CCA tRNA nucleotidyltransferase [Paracoccaceae bacterium]